MASNTLTEMVSAYKTAIAISVVVLLGVLGAGVNTLWQRGHGDNKAVAAAVSDPSCDLQRRDCQGVFSDGGRITLSIEPRPIQPLRSLRLRVTTEGVEPRAVAVNFSGVDMDMGYNRFSLIEQSPGDFQGSGMLALCIRERMAWEATVLAETVEGLVTASFRFDVSRP
jgi:hypothetical protein